MTMKQHVKSLILCSLVFISGTIAAQPTPTPAPEPNPVPEIVAMYNPQFAAGAAPFGFFCRNGYKKAAGQVIHDTNGWYGFGLTMGEARSQALRSSHAELDRLRLSFTAECQQNNGPTAIGSFTDHLIPMPGQNPNLCVLRNEGIWACVWQDKRNAQCCVPN